MSPKQKQIILVILFIAATALIAAGIIFILFRPPSLTPTPTPNEEPGNIGQLPESQPGTGGNVIPDNENGEGTNTPGTLPGSEVASGGLTNVQQLTTGTISTPTISGNNIAYYDPADGRFYTINANGEVVALTDTPFPNAENVTIAPSAEAAAIEFPDGSNILYNFTTQKQINLPSHWEDFAFSSTSTEVASKSIGVDANNRALVVTSADGSRTTPIAALGNNQDRVTVNWSPNNQIVGFSDTGSVQNSFGRKQIFLIGSDGGEKGALIVEGGNFSGTWSPSGNNILYSIAYSARNNRPSLWLANATGTVGTERKYLNIETWVEKCTFQNETTILCAVPNSVPDESGFDQDLVTAPDNLFSINISSGRSTLLAIPSDQMQMHNLSISEDGTVLYFTNENGQLSSMNLR